ncbi:MAG: outer membrane beta-barrel protein [Pseudomonadales bacterium]|nr:outer membrane beta-barrel protein [Pseudomonadales bacterium]
MKKYLTGLAVLFSAIVSMHSISVSAHEAGDIILRVGATKVEPDESSSLISTAATGALGMTGVAVDDSTQLGLNVVYMFSDNWALEVLAATPFEHDLTAEGLDQYGFNTTDLGSSKQLPPTVSALYFFGSAQSTIRPYVGLGVNYTTFFDKSLSNAARTELAATGLDIDDSFGLSTRAGLDIQLSNNWMLNASVWNIDIETDASFDSALGKVKVGVDVDPWVYMLSIAYKF